MKINLISKLRAILSSKRFFVFIIVFFCLQALFYAFAVRYGAPPDEGYHYNSIQYYAEAPLFEGPFLGEQDPETIARVRSIERIPSYLYHYLLSFPARLMNALSFSKGLQVLIFRIFNVALVVATLFALKNVLDQISKDEALKNASVAAISLTGMFVWLAGAINYDNLANLLFMIFVLQIIKGIRKPSTLNLFWVTGLSFSIILTKYSFAPVCALGVLVSAFFLFRNFGANLSKYKKSFLTDYAKNRVISILAVIFLLFSSLLFAERIVVNLISYHAVQPKCTAFHTVEQCNTHNLYRGHYERRIEFQQEGGRASLNLNLITHTAEWINRYYNRLFGYFGHNRFNSNIRAQLTVFIFVIFLFGTLMLSRRKEKLRPEIAFLIVVTIFYVATLYLFNLNTYLSIGARTAYHGRYLVPVLGFIYFYVGYLILRTSASLKPKARNPFLYCWVFVILIVTLAHFPPYLFMSNTNEAWYSQEFKDLRIIPSLNPAHRK